MAPQEPSQTQPPADAPCHAGDDPEESFRCKYCGSETVEDVVQAALRTARGWLILEDVPARVCRQCGEQFYDDLTAERIERITADRAGKPEREITVPVFSLAKRGNPA